MGLLISGVTASAAGCRKIILSMTCRDVTVHLMLVT